MTKFYGVWFPGLGWFRIIRETPTGMHQSVCWASTDKALARHMAKRLHGRVEPVDDALGSEDAQDIIIKAEQWERAKESLWHKIKAFRPGSSTT